MRAVDLIRRKRDSAALTRDEIHYLIQGYTSGEIPEYQMSAWLMAVVCRGMTPDEIAALTEAMLQSGKVLDFSGLSGAKVDKHSTGGVGDKTSLVIAPIAAAGGLCVPMMSGRGLGHTGGTLDKLESIPGFNVNLTLAEFRHVLEACGCGLIGQTAEIAPADKKIYALRDVSGTVESPALLCSSIMSKKLAEGLDALVLDVKTGSGAFMKSFAEAEGLATLLVDTATRMGVRVAALITDMDQPLGRTAGNALEVAEAIDVLSGSGPADLRQLCLELSAWMFYLGSRVTSVQAGKSLAAEQIATGRALTKLREIVRLQGGDERTIENPGLLPQAKHVVSVLSAATGYVHAMQCEQLGRACVMLGAGRATLQDSIDPAVGLTFHKKCGDAVRRGELLCTMHYNSHARAAEVQQMIEAAYRITPDPPAPRSLFQRVIYQADLSAATERHLSREMHRE
jgi:pyrimidine-nucleoside phosphorylase